MVEITYRTVQGRFLLRPGPELDELVVGVLARAQSLYPVELVGIVVLSNHLHLLLWVESQYHLTRFMQHFGGNTAKEVNTIRDWSGSLWSRRYRSICVTEEPAAQVARLEYLLSQAVKENLTKKVEQWPGIHFGKTLMQGRSLLVGKWVDRTKRYRAAVQGRKTEEKEYTTPMTVELAQLPCWRHLTWDRYVRRIQKMIRRIEREAERERERQGVTVVGVPWICQQNPHSRPAKLEKSPAPLVHAASKEARLAWREAFGIFVAAFYAASELLRKGARGGVFSTRVALRGRHGWAPVETRNGVAPADDHRSGRRLPRLAAFTRSVWRALALVYPEPSKIEHKIPLSGLEALEVPVERSITD